MKHTLVLLVIGIPAWCCLVLSKIFWGQVQYNELEEFSTVTKSQHMHGRFSQNCLFWAEETCVLPLVSDDISMEFRAIFFQINVKTQKFGRMKTQALRCEWTVWPTLSNTGKPILPIGIELFTGYFFSKLDNAGIDFWVFF